MKRLRELDIKMRASQNPTENPSTLIPLRLYIFCEQKKPISTVNTECNKIRNNHVEAKPAPYNNVYGTASTYLQL